MFCLIALVRVIFLRKNNDWTFMFWSENPCIYKHNNGMFAFFAFRVSWLKKSSQRASGPRFCNPGAWKATHTKINVVLYIHRISYQHKINRMFTFVAFQAPGVQILGSLAPCFVLILKPETQTNANIQLCFVCVYLWDFRSTIETIQMRVCLFYNKLNSRPKRIKQP